MGYFAEINSDSIVQRVIVADQSFIDSGVVGEQSIWLETSDSGDLRKNYAGVGYTYDKAKDAFIAPQPYPSWTLVEATCQWESPVAHPADGNGPYRWDEDIVNWVKVQHG